MNLMGMVNGLNRMDDTNPFSPTAFLLAVKLIDLFNRLFWADSVAVDLNRMGVMAKCSSKATITRARDELVERGVLVIVRKGKKGTPTTYRMNDLSVYCSKNEQYPGTNPVPNSEQYPEQYPGTNPVPNSVPIIRQDNNTDTTRHFEVDEGEGDGFDARVRDVREVVATSFMNWFGTPATPAELNDVSVLFVNKHLEQLADRVIRMAAQAAPNNRFAYIRTLATSLYGDYIRTEEDLDDHTVMQNFIRQFPDESTEWVQKLLEARKLRKENYTQ